MTVGFLLLENTMHMLGNTLATEAQLLVDEFDCTLMAALLQPVCWFDIGCSEATCKRSDALKYLQDNDIPYNEAVLSAGLEEAPRLAKDVAFKRWNEDIAWWAQGLDPEAERLGLYSILHLQS